MHSTGASRGLLPAAGAAAARRCLATDSVPHAPASAQPTTTPAGNGADLSNQAQDPTAAPARPASAPLLSELGALPTEPAPKRQFQYARWSGPSPYAPKKRQQVVPYVPPSQGGTLLASDRHLTVQGSNLHHRAGEMYTPADLDESQPKTFPPAVPSLNTIQFDVFKAMGTDPLASYKDVTLLSNFVTETGMLMHRKHTKLSAKNQRKLTKAVKRARAMGLMPHTYRMETQTEKNRGVGIADFLNLTPRM
ncbi:hypothetical protein BCR44DRAFT_33648 [Catenaria anguillulae PL171]|uniref:Small ribosomal subunit protein bS18m n=1 Tax=Catenaria anguillulae PL171 TaxID=765915 RepID=A0A1Y2HJR1_9FUNG|nr:hypothetical protein BCR44DRAFT_33648 [Catenaria anguillulae PL171]